MPKKVGIKDVSERAGVAISTVSHVLNGTASISEPVRRRVLDAAGELGYLANRRARGAISSLTKVLVAAPPEALPHNDVNLVSWTILTSISRECSRRGIRFEPYTVEPGDAPARLVAALEASGADGLVLIHDDNEALLSAIAKSGVPAVLINGEDPNMLIDSVTPGNRFAAQNAVRWLIGQGHRRVLHLTWRGRKTVQRRLDGFHDACREAGLSDGDAQVLMASDYTPEAGRAAMRGWIEDHPDLDGVTAIFCAADNLAFGATAALMDAGIDVPGQMSVVGFDGVALGELHVPPLTTVAVPFDEFGEEALSLLERRRSAGETSRVARRVELGCHVAERGSHARRS